MLVNSKVIVFIDHATFKHLIKKSNSKPYLNRWALLLNEFDLELHDKAGLETMVADHLSSLGLEVTSIEELPSDGFSLNDQLLVISHQAIFMVC